MIKFLSAKKHQSINHLGKKNLKMRTQAPFIVRVILHSRLNLFKSSENNPTALRILKTAQFTLSFLFCTPSLAARPSLISHPSPLRSARGEGKADGSGKRSHLNTASRIISFYNLISNIYKIIIISSPVVFASKGSEAGIRESRLGTA